MSVRKRFRPKFLFVLAAGCSRIILSQPCGWGAPLASVNDLRVEAKTAHKLILNSPGENTLAADLHSVSDHFAAFDLGHLDSTTLRQDAPEIIQSLWNVRLTLLDRLRSLSARRAASVPLIEAVRRYLFVSRSLEEQVGEAAFDVPTSRDESAVSAFTVRDTNWLISPSGASSDTFGVHGLDPSKLRSGDVLLIRRSAATSAVIGQISLSAPSQFSHLAMIYRDPRDPNNLAKMCLLQATFEAGGLNCESWDEAMRDHVERVELLRYLPQPGVRPDCPEAAAEIVYQRLARHEHVPYEFDMKPDRDYSKLFCTKVIQEGYDQACEVELPLYRTALDRPNPDFIHLIGVEATQTFAPSDLELDPRFEVLGEWRDYEATPMLSRRDVIASRTLDWMDRDHLRIALNVPLDVLTWFVQELRKTQGPHGWVQRDLDVPSGVSLPALRALAGFQFTLDAMDAWLTKANQANLHARGTRLSPNQMRSDLDFYRQHDGLCHSYVEGPNGRGICGEDSR